MSERVVSVITYELAPVVTEVPRVGGFVRHSQSSDLSFSHRCSVSQRCVCPTKGPPLQN